MPDVPIKPPNKRVVQIKDELTAEMWDKFRVNEGEEIRREHERTFLIEKIAELIYVIEEMKGNPFDLS